jgi:aspartyl-tRNA(Asn)/glutamyl-tRNA(Gln) amidotransferase subunit A
MYLNDVYTVIANLAGGPAISFPAGFAEAKNSNDRTLKLPIGLQLIGPVFQEDKLLRIARVFEASTDFSTARPESAC